MRRRDQIRHLLRLPRVLTDLVLRARYRFTYDLMPAELRDMSLAQRRNMLLSGLNLCYRRAKPHGWPLYMQVEITNYCTLRCPVCPTGIGALRRKRGALDPELFARLIDEVGDYPLVMSLFSWGEPLLHPDLPRVLEIARRCRAVTLLSTNGQNLDDEGVQDALLRHPPDYLIVAIDGLTDQTNQVFRIGARLDPALRGVSGLANAKRARGQEHPILHMRFLVMKQNQHEVPQLTGFARQHGFDMLSTRTLSIIDASEEAHRRLIPDLAQYRAYAYCGGERVRRDDFICERAYVSATMLVDGSLVPCDQDFNGQLPYGAFPQDGTFRDIWFSDRARSIRQRIEREPDGITFCRKCPHADRGTATCSMELHDLRTRPTGHAPRGTT
ncbi:radical SAM/SPASM domain-containing protein [Planctomycetota bacterium]